MTDRSRYEQFEDVEERYSIEEDKEIIKANRKAYQNAKNLSDLSLLPGGKLLVKHLKDEISKNIQLLIETRKGRYVSDIESNLTLLTKITQSKNQVDAIASWLDSLN